MRYGGDEFVVLLEKTGGLKQTEAVAEGILREIREPFRTEGREIVISASIGAAVASGHEFGLDDLVEATDRASYEAKLLGKGRYVPRLSRQRLRTRPEALATAKVELIGAK